MYQRNLICFLLIFYSAFASAKNKYFVILGGGGEPKGPTTIFDHSLKKIGEFTKTNPDYQVDISFNGGHTETERIIKEDFKNLSNQRFTEKSFEQIISKYENLIETGEIKAGDNLLLSFDTHGSVKYGETHHISTVGETVSDLRNLGGRTVSMDRLKKLTQLAEEKGVNLGIIDLSCYSGNTLRLANSKTCVISGAGPEHVGLASTSNLYFSNNIFRQLISSTNLEQAFLKARKERTGITYPMISSPQGQEVQKNLYAVLTPYIYFQSDETAHQFIDFISSDFLEGDQCRVNSGFETLNQFIKKYISDDTNFHLKMALFQLQYEVKKYYDFIDSIKKEMGKAGFGVMKKKLKFCDTIPANKELGTPEVTECIENYNLEMISNLNIGPIYDYYRNQSQNMSLDPKDRARNLAIYSCYKKMEGWRNYILKENPQFLLINDFWKKTYPFLTTQTRDKAKKIIEAEKEVYHLLYDQSNARATNPCKNFEI